MKRVPMLAGLVGFGALVIAVGSLEARQNVAKIQHVRHNLYLIMPAAGARPGSASTTAAFGPRVQHVDSCSDGHGGSSPPPLVPGCR